MRSSKKEREFQEKCRKEVLDAQTNMKNFWDVHGKETTNKFSKPIKCWSRKEENLCLINLNFHTLKCTI